MDRSINEKTGRFLQVWRVATLLDCTETHVRDLIRTGKLGAIRIGKRAVRVSENSLHKYINERKIEPTEFDLPPNN